MTKKTLLSEVKLSHKSNLLWLLSLKKTKNVTLDELADMTGLNPPRISMVLNGRIDARKSTYDLIERALVKY